MMYSLLLRDSIKKAKRDHSFVWILIFGLSYYFLTLSNLVQYPYLIKLIPSANTKDLSSALTRYSEDTQIVNIKCLSHVILSFLWNRFESNCFQTRRCMHALICSVEIRGKQAKQKNDESLLQVRHSLTFQRRQLFTFSYMQNAYESTKSTRH